MGVGIRNLWVKPSVQVLADEPADQANRVRRTTLKVEGLLCSLWVLNVRRALSGLEGVRDLTVKGEGDLVDVMYAPAETSVEAICKQVMDTVVLPAVRSWLGRLSSSSP